MNDVCNIDDVQIHEDKTPRITFKVGVIEDFKQTRGSNRRVYPKWENIVFDTACK